MSAVLALVYWCYYRGMPWDTTICRRFWNSENCKNRCFASRGIELDNLCSSSSLYCNSYPMLRRSELAGNCDRVIKLPMFSLGACCDMMSPVQAVGCYFSVPVIKASQELRSSASSSHIGSVTLSAAPACQTYPNPACQTGASWAFGQTASGRFVLC